MKTAKKYKNLTKGPIEKELFLMAFPLTFGIFANMSFNIVDTYFLGQVGVKELNAISFSFPVVIVFLNLAIGGGIGINAILSQLLGSGNEEDAKSLAGLSVFITSLVAILLCSLGLLTTRPLFLFLGAKPSLIPTIHDYMQYTYIAMSIRIVAMAISAVFRSYGDTLTPSKIIFVTAICNLILDPLLIFGYGPFPKMGIEGAGLATLIANLVAFLFSFYLVYFQHAWLNFTWTKKHFKLLKKVFFISIPAAASNALNPLSVAFLNYLVATIALDAVGGVGVATKIQAFIMIPTFALSAAVSTFVGQNYSVGNKDRILKGLKATKAFALIWPIVAATLLLWFSEPLARLFSNDAKVILAATEYLNIVPWSLFGYGFIVLGSAAMNTSGKPYTSMLFISARTFILFVPLAFIGKYYFGFSGIILAQASSNIIAGLYCFIKTRKFFQNMPENS